MAVWPQVLCGDLHGCALVIRLQEATNRKREENLKERERDRETPTQRERERDERERERERERGRESERAREGEGERGGGGGAPCEWRRLWEGSLDATEVGGGVARGQRRAQTLVLRPLEEAAVRSSEQEELLRLRRLWR